MSTLASVIQSGLFSALPAASIAGRLYYCTDTSGIHVGERLRDNGASWDVIGYAAVGGPSGMVQISQNVLGSPAASVAFSSIPATFSSLLLVFNARSATSAASDDVRCKINTDTTSGNYIGEVMDAFGNTTAKAFPAAASAAGLYVATIAAATALAGAASATSILFPAYAATTFLKNAHCTTTALLGSSFAVANLDTTVIGTMWNSTAAIATLTLSLTSAANFATGSTFTLYGIY